MSSEVPVSRFMTRLALGAFALSLIGGCSAPENASREAAPTPSAAPVADANPAISSVASRTDASLRDVTFGDRFKVLGLTIDRNPQGIVMRIAWQAVTATPLDRLICVHMVNDQGEILAGADYRQTQYQPSLTSPVAMGTSWVDEVPIDTKRLTGATGIGLCMYHLTEPHLAIDRGPRDWNGVRLRVPLPPAS